MALVPYIFHSPKFKREISEPMIANLMNKDIPCYSTEVQCPQFMLNFIDWITDYTDEFWDHELVVRIVEKGLDTSKFYDVLNHFSTIFFRMANKLTRYNFFDLSYLEDTNLDMHGLTMAEQQSQCSHNFASSSSGAGIVKSPQEADGASNLLDKSTDRYLIVPCHEKKSFIVSLSENAIIEKFLLLNAEEFSSTVEYFSVYGSDSYDSKNQTWEKMGDFVANNDFNGHWQSFKVKENWARYIRFEWKTFYGSHHY